MKEYDATAVRLQLRDAGYQPIPNQNKECWYPGWNARDYRKLGAIESWPKRFKATGIRVTDGLRVIDIDIDHPLAGLVIAAVKDIAPDVFDYAPTRYGASQHKVALFARAPAKDEVFAKLPCRAYFAGTAAELEAARAAKTVKAKRMTIELFGGGPANNGNVRAQFGVFGPHSHDTAGKVLANYSWSGPDLTEVPLAELPEISKKQMGQIADAFEKLAEKEGWQRLDTPEGTSSGARVYDIVDTMRFDTDRGGRGLTFQQLGDELAACEGLRCSTSFLPGRGDDGRTDHCSVFHSERHDCTAVYVYGDDQTHYPAEVKPATADISEEFAAMLRALQQGAKQGLADEMPPEPRNLTPREQAAKQPIKLLEERVAWLLRTHAFEQGEIANVYRSAKGLTMKAAHARFINWKLDQEGPEGGKLPPLLAFNLWLGHEARLTIAGIQMRPDQPYPLFWEDGQLWRNRYVPPRHDRVEVTPAQITDAGAVFGRLVRNIAAGPGEAAYLLQHLAHKIRHPAVPGCGILFVNPVFGSGRDLFFMIASAMLGAGNTSRQDVKRIIGGNGRSTFNAWMASDVLTYVPEVYDHEHRRDSYELLKTAADPRADRVSVNRKGIEERSEMRFSTLWMATNHNDAMPIEEGDRRVSVLRGGPQLDDAFSTAMEGWRQQPVNIAALWRYMQTIDLVGYVAHRPLETETKTLMMQLGKDRVLQALQDIAEDEKRKWRVFTIDQLERRVEAQLGLDQHSRSDRTRFLDLRHRSARAKLVVAAMRSDTHKQRRIRVKGAQEYLYCFRQDAEEVTTMSEAEVETKMPEAKLTSVLGQLP